VLCAAAALMPAELGDKADPFAPAYADIRPEWYFVFMFEVLKQMPGGEILGIEYEAIPILFFGLGALLMLLVPFIDNDPENRRRSRWTSWVGAAALVFMVGMTAWGYRSLLPVWIMVGMGALMFVLGAATRRISEEGA
jgi:quinol-cytochrome oxidoreductase complex cytochrome b subunit